MKRCVVELWLASIMVLAVALGPTAASGTERLYRYHDSEGVLVINHTLPAQYVADGYEVLDRRGRLLEVVAPPQSAPFSQGADRGSFSPDDLEALDRMLRASYSSASQIAAARDRRLSQLERQVSLIRATLEQTAVALTRERERAARHERAGEAVPESILGNLAKLRRQRESTAHTRRIREAELEAVQKQYDAYLTRFARLQSAAEES